MLALDTNSQATVFGGTQTFVGDYTTNDGTVWTAVAGALHIPGHFVSFVLVANQWYKYNLDYLEVVERPTRLNWVLFVRK